MLIKVFTLHLAFKMILLSISRNNKMKLCKFLLLTTALLIANVSASDFLSQFTDPVDGRLDASTFLAENAFGFLPVPVIITDPAFDGGLGLMGLIFHESKEDAEKRKQAMLTSNNAAKHLLPPSVSALGYIQTGNDSWTAGGGHMGFFNQGKIKYVGGAGYGDINLNFYGFGEIELKQPVELKTKAVGIVQTLKFKVPDSKVYVGIKQSYMDAEIAPTNFPEFDGDILPPEWQDGIEDKIRDLLTKKITTSGLGFALEYDSRDNVFSPSEGYQYSFEYMVFSDKIGSDKNYQLTTFEGLNYWQLSKQFNAGLKIASEIADTDDFLPPYALPSMKIRGVPSGRYQGTHTFATEAEVSYDLDSRWRVLGFVGAGRVGNEMSSIKHGDTKVSKGLGFRYQVARRYGFFTGLDVAFGPEETVWYIQAGSAW